MPLIFFVFFMVSSIVTFGLESIGTREVVWSFLSWLVTVGIIFAWAFPAGILAGILKQLKGEPFFAGILYSVVVFFTIMSLGKFFWYPEFHPVIGTLIGFYTLVIFIRSV